MSTYRLTPAAQRDLSSIWDFSVARWDARQAEIYLDEIRLAFERIAADPGRGRACDEVRQGYRCYRIGSHSVFYVESVGGVDVIRVLHQRMDPLRHF